MARCFNSLLKLPNPVRTLVMQYAKKEYQARVKGSSWKHKKKTQWHCRQHRRCFQTTSGSKNKQQDHYQLLANLKCSYINNQQLHLLPESLWPMILYHTYVGWLMIRKWPVSNLYTVMQKTAPQIWHNELPITASKWRYLGYGLTQCWLWRPKKLSHCAHCTMQRRPKTILKWEFSRSSCSQLIADGTLISGLPDKILNSASDNTLPT